MTATSAATLRCPYCDAGYARPYRHRTLGAVCPACQAPLAGGGQGDPRPWARPPRAFRARSYCPACRRFWMDEPGDTRQEGNPCAACGRPLVGCKKGRPVFRQLPQGDFLADFAADHAGHPLGHGMPMGRTLRVDGETHRQAWERIVRADPCAYCGCAGGTVDHIVPKDPLVSPPGLGGKYSWLNYAGSCEACNGSKAAQPLLGYLWVRATSGMPQARAA